MRIEFGSRKPVREQAPNLSEIDEAYIRIYKQAFIEARRVLNHTSIPDNVRQKAIQLAADYAKARVEDQQKHEQHIREIARRILEILEENATLAKVRPESHEHLQALQEMDHPEPSLVAWEPLLILSGSAHSESDREIMAGNMFNLFLNFAHGLGFFKDPEDNRRELIEIAQPRLREFQSHYAARMNLELRHPQLPIDIGFSGARSYMELSIKYKNPQMTRRG